MEIFTLLVAAALLLVGRELYWVFVGAIGFLVGFHYASDWLVDQPMWIIFVIAVLAGLIGALLAVFLQRIALGIAGFFGGGYFAFDLALRLGADPNAGGAIAFLAGGVIAAILVVVLLDPALIVLSSLVGASMISQAFEITETWRWILFAALAVLGIVVQSSLLAYRRRRPPAAA